MASTRTEPESRPTSRKDVRWNGRAFALEIDAPRPLLGVPAATRDVTTPSRARINFLSTSEFDYIWPSNGVERVFERRFDDGRPMLTVDYAASVGYRIWAPQHGRHLVAEDGRTITSALPVKARWWWQRLLLAQVLPIAATLQGFELLHASAVAFDAGAVAITAEAGTGKTTLAAHLLDLGGELMADDVLALGVESDAVLAHPGVGLVNIDPVQREGLGPRAGRLLTQSPGRGEDSYVIAPIVPRPVPLAAVYFLDRRRDITKLRIVDAQSDPRRLLGSSFLSFLDGPARLLAHLEVCSRIAAGTPPFVIEAPVDVPASELASLVYAHGRERW
jgi:hypothetical protein